MVEPPVILGRRAGQSPFALDQGQETRFPGYTPPDRWGPRGKRMPYKGGFYTASVDASGLFPVDLSLTIDLKEIVDSVVPGGSLAQAVFVGHLPDCEFDEMVCRMYNASGGYTDPFDYDDTKRAELIAFQITGQGIEKGAIREVSGIESTVLAKNGAVFRERLRVPFRTQTLWSVTMGGPIEPLAPLFIFVQPDGITSIEAAGWKLIVTFRVMMQGVL